MDLAGARADALALEDQSEVVGKTVMMMACVLLLLLDWRDFRMMFWLWYMGIWMPGTLLVFQGYVFFEFTIEIDI